MTIGHHMMTIGHHIMTIGHHMMTNGHYKIINTYNIVKSGHRKNSYSVPYKDALDSLFLSYHIHVRVTGQCTFKIKLLHVHDVLHVLILIYVCHS